MRDCFCLDLLVPFEGTFKLDCIKLSAIIL